MKIELNDELTLSSTCKDKFDLDSEMGSEWVRLIVNKSETEIKIDSLIRALEVMRAREWVSGGEHITLK